jgi:CRP/FNR family transcriptional regulator
MRSERQAKLLSMVDVLEPLSGEELQQLAKRCPDLRVERGQHFYRPEEHNGSLFLIKEGHVRVYLTTAAGKEVTLELLGSGTSRLCMSTPCTSKPSSRASWPS